MDNCIKCHNHKVIGNSEIKEVRCYYEMILSGDRVPLEMYVGLIGEGIKKGIKPPNGCPLNADKDHKNE